MKEDNWWIAFVRWIMRKSKLIEERPVSKNEMCKKAQDICNHDCDSCIWMMVEK